VTVATYDITVNGRARRVESSDPEQPLLYALRNALDLTGAKFGCGLGQCGACTVLIDGQPTRSCQASIASVAGRSITTVEGLGSSDRLHAVQQAFVAEQAAQCGYCASGMVMTVAALLQRNPQPTLDQAKDALAGQLCRCGTHHRILRAAMRASGRPLP
jgi:nicotinate dehydrogenase subunit A